MGYGEPGHRRMRMPRILRILLTGLSFFVFSALGAVVGYVLMPLSRIGARDREQRIARSQWTLHTCARVYIWFMALIGLFRLRPPAAPPAPMRDGQPCVIIANHPALLDIMWITSLFPKIAFLAKAEWFHSPFIAPILRYADHISGPRVPTDGSPMDGAVVLERMLDRLRRGRSVVIFPEGTRSPAGGLGNFHKGAFEAAMRGQVPLVMLRITVDPPSLLKGQAWYEVPDRHMDVNIRVLDVIEPPDFPATARQFRRQVRARYAESLGIASSTPTRDVEASRSASRHEAAAI